MNEGDQLYPEAGSEKPRGRKARRGGRLWRLGTLLSALLTFSLVVVAAVIGGLYLFKLYFEQPGPLTKDETVIITSGSALSTIARTLERKGVVSDDRLFMLGVLINRADGKLKAGEYLFEAHISMDEVLGKLVQGKSIRHKVTLAEGLTSYEIIEKLRQNDVLIGETEAIPPEGSLLPETYLFQRGLTRAQLLERMRKAQEKLMAELWPERAPGLAVKTPEEALILASIVEKETGVAEERRQVAAVFHNRLRRSMRLQSDPTIIYGITKGEGPLGRPIRQSEIEAKTPYNTYQVTGLPPTPIANPGRASIEAVLDPADSKHLYFVADGSGGHVFAETLDEHLKNVAAWRKVQAEMRRKAEEEEAEATEDAEASDGGRAEAGQADAGGTGKSDKTGRSEPKPASAD